MEAPKITVVKENKLVDYYTVRNGGEWGSIFIRSYKGGGIFSALTSFGDYSYHWGGVGEKTFKEFLSRLDYCYFMGKTTKRHGQIFDFEKSQKQLFKMIVDTRKSKEIDAVQAREFYEEVESLEYCTSDDSWYHQIYSEDFNHELFELVIGDYENIPNETKECPQCMGFWNRIYKPLIEEFKKEKE